MSDTPTRSQATGRTAKQHPTGQDVTLDQFLGGALTLTQPARGYRAGIDPVLLAATCTAAAGSRIIDCGAGVGTVGLSLARRLPNVTVTLLEREPAYATLARANIAANQLTDRVAVVEADLTAPLSTIPELAADIGGFDHALANPPYAIDTAGTRARDPLKDAANAMPADDLDAWLRFMTAMVRPGGTATLIHRAEALPALLTAMDGRFGGLLVRPIHPHETAPANRLIISGTKGSRAPLTLRPPLVLHNETGGYRPAIEAVLRTPAALP